MRGTKLRGPLRRPSSFHFGRCWFPAIRHPPSAVRCRLRRPRHV